MGRQTRNVQEREGQSNSIIKYKSSMFFHLIAFTYAASFNTPGKLLSQSVPETEHARMPCTQVNAPGNL